MLSAVADDRPVRSRLLRLTVDPDCATAVRIGRRPRRADRCRSHAWCSDWARPAAGRVLVTAHRVPRAAAARDRSIPTSTGSRGIGSSTGELALRAAATSRAECRALLGRVDARLVPGSVHELHRLAASSPWSTLRSRSCTHDRGTRAVPAARARSAWSGRSRWLRERSRPGRGSPVWRSGSVRSLLGEPAFWTLGIGQANALVMLGVRASGSGRRSADDGVLGGRRRRRSPLRSSSAPCSVLVYLALRGQWRAARWGAVDRARARRAVAAPIGRPGDLVAGSRTCCLEVSAADAVHGEPVGRGVARARAHRNRRLCRTRALLGSIHYLGVLDRRRRACSCSGACGATLALDPLRARAR